MLSAAGAIATVYADELAATLADIQDINGVAIPSSTLTLDEYSRLPLFLGPDGGVDTLYVTIAGGPMVAIYALTDNRFDATLQKAANLSDLGSPATARTNLGLGGSATLNVGTATDTVAAGDDSRITGAAQRSFLALNVREDYGAVGDGVTDDTASFVAALTDASTEGRDLYVPPGTYKMSAGITWDAVTHSIIAGGNVVLDFTSLAAGTAITVTGQGNRTSVFGFLQFLHKFSGIKILGPDTDATTVDAISISDTSNGSNVNFENVLVYGFRDQVIFGDNTWLIRFDKCGFSHAHRRCINAQSVNNAGENYSFYGCAFYSSTNASGNATAIYNDVAGNSDLYFYGCSFDYNDIEIDHQAGHITLSGCHVEDHGTGPMFKLTYTPGFEYTTLMMSGGTVSPTEAAPGRDHLIEFVSGNAIRLSLDGVKFTTWNRTTDITKVISGTPTMVINGGDIGVGTAPNIARPGALMNLMTNGDFELGNFNGWFPQGTVTYTIQSATKKSGTYAAKIAGTGVVGTTAMRQYIPCPPNTDVIFSAEMASDSMVGGSTIPRIQWLGTDRTVLSTSTFTGVTANQAFTRMGGKVVSPPGTAYMEVQLYSSNLNGNVYVDDVYVAVMRPVSGSVVMFGTGSNQAAAGNDSRIVNAAKTTDIQSFTVPGSYTWVKPAGAKTVQVIVIGGGGGGGSGRRGAAGTVRCGGGGGGGGGMARLLLNAADIPDNCPLIVGVGGGGGSSFAINDNSDGAPGGGGGTSVFNDSTTASSTSPRVKAAGGAGGLGGSATNGTGGVSNFSPLSGSSGGSASGAGGVGNHGGDPAAGGAGGGSGGGITSGDVPGNGGDGGVNAYLDQSRAAAGVAPGGVGGTGRATLSMGPGNGGAGGAGSVTGPAGAGGVGGSYGGGGGGGGASLNGNAVGAGGKGGDGAVFVITSF